MPWASTPPPTCSRLSSLLDWAVGHNLRRHRSRLGSGQRRHHDGPHDAAAGAPRSGAGAGVPVRWSDRRPAGRPGRRVARGRAIGVRSAARRHRLRGGNRPVVGPQIRTTSRAAVAVRPLRAPWRGRCDPRRGVPPGVRRGRSRSLRRRHLDGHGRVPVNAPVRRAPEVRGRAFALYDVLWNGARLVSLGLGGVLAEAVSIRSVYVLGGVLLLAAAAVGFTTCIPSPQRH